MFIYWGLLFIIVGTLIALSTSILEKTVGIYMPTGERLGIGIGAIILGVFLFVWGLRDAEKNETKSKIEGATQKISRICPNCREPYYVEKEESEICKKCNEKLISVEEFLSMYGEY